MGDNSPKDVALKVKQWPKESIAAGPRHTVGLRSDGMVTAVGEHERNSEIAPR
jgi:hypothetical protein